MVVKTTPRGYKGWNWVSTMNNNRRDFLKLLGLVPLISGIRVRSTEERIDKLVYLYPKQSPYGYDYSGLNVENPIPGYEYCWEKTTSKECSQGFKELKLVARRAQ